MQERQFLDYPYVSYFKQFKIKSSKQLIALLILLIFLHVRLSTSSQRLSFSFKINSTKSFCYFLLPHCTHLFVLTAYFSQFLTISFPWSSIQIIRFLLFSTISFILYPFLHSKHSSLEGLNRIHLLFPFLD